jgi:hypothetical protein
MKLPARTACLAVLAAAAATLSACHSTQAAAPSRTPSPPPSPPTPPRSSRPAPTATTTPATTHTKTKKHAVNPLTGGKPSKHKVVAVKIDDTGNGRPQVGIRAADIVYIEQVEGGLTRLLAVYNSKLPTRVEPVRSTRAGDPELLGEYGPVAYVTSGGAHNPLKVLDRSNLHSDVNDRNGPGFRRDPHRLTPYNLRANLRHIAKVVHSVKARDIGLRWSKHVTNRPHRTGRRVRTRIGKTAIQFNWSHTRRRYVRLINGRVQHTANGKVIAPRNVVVQFCKVNIYTKDRDVLGNANYYTHTVGHGKVVVFRNGKSIDGKWSRRKLHSPTKLRDRHGTAITLAPGGAWFVLVARTAPLRR